MFEIIKNLILIIGTFLGIYSAPLGDAVLKVPKSDILYSNKFTDTIYDKDGKIISEIPMILYAYKSAEIAPILDNEIIEKRTEHIVTKNLGGNKRSAESGYNFYKEGTEWKQVKFATTTKEIFDKETLNPISYLIKQVFAAQTASTSPQTMADDATVGTVEWVNPNNAKVSDNVYATVNLTSGASHYLKATNFGFSIATGATINGILVEVEAKTNVYNLTNSTPFRLLKDGVYSSAKTLPGNGITSTETYHSYGSSSDLWGGTWTPTNINDAGFGGSFYCTNSVSDTVSVDHIRITVYYTEEEAGPPTPSGGIINFE